MLGIDLVQISELQTQINNGGQTLFSKAFHPAEIQNDSLEHLAGLWAAKEAVMKAAGLTAGSWLDITISRSPAGRPFATVAGQDLEISISHHGDYAVAVAFSQLPAIDQQLQQIKETA